MSGQESRSKSLRNREIAREAVYRCVTRYRRVGLKTAAAITLIAPFLGVSPRRIHDLFFNQAPVPMTDSMRHSIRVGVANALRHRATQLRDWANEDDDEAWEIETSERKLYVLGAD